MTRRVTDFVGVINSVAFQTNIVALGKANATIADISRFSQEQSRDIDHVNREMDQLREATERNAATVENAATAAQKLVGEAASLLGSVAVFRLGEESSDAARSAA